jgi:integrative and conjugative element protein (TIGR02256 family)
VLAHFSRHRQRKWRQAEAGGQLFARLDGTEIFVEEATGPRPGDHRSRTGYCADRVAEQLEIDANYRGGLHYIGDWHTHPTPRPIPSGTDLRTISESVRISSHSLNGFMLIIVGTDPAPGGIYVLLHNGRTSLRLEAEWGGKSGSDA